MATTSETTYTHTCDLCGEVREASELARLHGKATNGLSQGPRADICADCRNRPLSEVLDFLSTEAAKGVTVNTARTLPASYAWSQADPPKAVTHDGATHVALSGPLARPATGR